MYIRISFVLLASECTQVNYHITKFLIYHVQLTAFIFEGFPYKVYSESTITVFDYPHNYVIELINHLIF